PPPPTFEKAYAWLCFPPGSGRNIPTPPASSCVTNARANYGGVQNRFDSVISSLQVSSENLTAARSRIMDADYAVETSNLSRAQILQQAL
ncbi:MAG: flagellin, partial [Rubrivivax sp.]